MKTFRRCLFLLAVFAAVLLFCTVLDRQCSGQTLTPGFLPGVWWGTYAAGPSVTVNTCQPQTYQPMARFRIRVRPWYVNPLSFAACPSPRPSCTPQSCRPQASCPPQGCNPRAPDWGQFQGQWGYGNPPQSRGTSEPPVELR